ncbi:globin [Corynebacterium glucuronolyticum]|nr:globin [Corynebacterium glucuronolyticum]
MDLGNPHMQDMSATIYQQLGEDYFHRLAAFFYEGVREDDVLLPMYPTDDLEGARNRLAWFLIQYFGGPMLYRQNRGAPMLRRRHMPFAVDQEAMEHWLSNMRHALDKAETPESVRPQMEAYFTRAAAAMLNT